MQRDNWRRIMAVIDVLNLKNCPFIRIWLKKQYSRVSIVSALTRPARPLRVFTAYLHPINN
jgi:hypothetical protein